ncbi:hypothetical protein [Candidatus Vidania fulgoroideorum]
MYNIVLVGLGNVSKKLLVKVVNQFKSSYLTIIIRKHNIRSKRTIEILKYKRNRIKVVTKYNNYISKRNIIIELIGDNIYSKDILLKAVIRKCILITANKNLIYKNIGIVNNYLNRNVFFEASIGGGVQIINTIYFIRKVLRIKYIYTIVNGTTNYILSNIGKYSLLMSEIIKSAKKKGISESIPIRDLVGFDSLNKITILSNIIVNISYIENIKSINMFGIRNITRSTLKFLYYNKIYTRLVSSFINKKGAFHIETMPYLLSKYNSLALNKSVYNTFIISTKAHGRFILKAKGAGPKITSISVLRNILEKKKLEKIGRNKNQHKHISGLIKTKILKTIKINIASNYITNIFKLGFKCKFTFYKKQLIILILSRNCIFRITKVFILVGKVLFFTRII